ncbi:MAG: pilus assembly protein PilX [Burkholderiaceae bacterium]|nr:pilus assembly protein PilX [Burkholderiaceae bacterium]
MKHNSCADAARARQAQRGLSLIITLVMLVGITLLGLAAIGGTVMQEKIAGNTRDMNLAFQAVEAGLRDAESDISRNISSSANFTSGCSLGLCTPASTWPTPTSTPLWKLINWNGGSTRTYGAYTGAAALSPDLAAPPLYVIEKLSTQKPGQGDSLGIGLAPNIGSGTYYRTTVYATGGRPDTHVVAQSVYLKH